MLLDSWKYNKIIIELLQSRITLDFGVQTLLRTDLWEFLINFYVARPV